MFTLTESAFAEWAGSLVEAHRNLLAGGRRRGCEQLYDEALAEWTPELEALVQRTIEPGGNYDVEDADYYQGTTFTAACASMGFCRAEQTFRSADRMWKFVPVLIVGAIVIDLWRRSKKGRR